jgi:hypothetical protein
MGWMLFQGAIIFAVVSSNIHWNWTPNGYLASLIGIGAAFVATISINGATGLLRRLRSKNAG